MGNKLVGRRRQVVDDKYTKPQGLYQHKDVDHKKLRKLILDSKLAPCYPGLDDPSVSSNFDLEECPICFLLVLLLSCVVGLEYILFLDNKRCPFCKTSNYAVEYRGVKTKEEKGIEQIEEQRVIEAKIRMRQQELQDDEERMQKRQDVSSSSSIVRSGEVEYSADAEPSSALECAVEGEERVSSQHASPNLSIRQPLRLRQNRLENSLKVLINIFKRHTELNPKYFIVDKIGNHLVSLHVAVTWVGPTDAVWTIEMHLRIAKQLCLTRWEARVQGG
ncbi:hypothetical protein AG4045_026323 [Apium graveolens]|uniref:RING-type domain-containing protein n=1 Tax=Apium graveolens TaxID=4045 RepID=A0A6L5B741_APIGR|nr:hypothetical protein AG4045_026323 [Apium graveolens]